MILAELVMVGPGKFMVANGRAQALVGLSLATPLIIKLAPIHKLYTTNIVSYSWAMTQQHITCLYNIQD